MGSRIWTISGSLHSVSTFLILLFDLISRVKKLTGYLDGNGEEIEIIETDHDQSGEEKLEMKLIFKFPSFQEFSRSHDAVFECKDEILSENRDVAIDDDHGFLSESDFGGLVSQNQTDFLTENDFIVEDPLGEISMESDDGGEEIKPECVWEHQELIDQLKMELRKVKATGLPTILEEPESPTVLEDLKQLKIGTKLLHQNSIDELHKFYKRYMETMRQFDILNYQKMYAMGFLEMKDHFQSRSELKPPALKSLVSHNLWLFKHRSHGSNPIKKLINELQGDLEVVYIGQICTTWEFLNLQYKKALELWSSDPHGIHHYNEVAGEFQHFQVLIQRFMEDETFQGPRVENYVKNRCILRNLLQVPMIREDDMNGKNKMKMMEKDAHSTTTRTLVEIIEESIRIFWRFLQSEPESNKKMADVHNQEDLKLLVEVRKVLGKKERKVKENVMRRGRYMILKRFGQERGGNKEDWDEALNFLWQVELKLVNRALRMRRMSREQLVWCRNKLRIIGDSSVFLDPSFSVFPY